jgi:membrane-associated phospholipid phosphatase
MNRRIFMKRLGHTASLPVLGNVGLGGLAESAQASGLSVDSAAVSRSLQAFQIRRDAAFEQTMRIPPISSVNSDEEIYASKMASYTKGLPHNHLGEVELSAYAVFLKAMRTGNPDDCAAIPMGGAASQVNPMAAFSFQLIGADSHDLSLPAAPAFASATQAGEMAELYWAALARDVPFSQYGLEPVTAAAIQDLQRFPAYSHVSAGNLFRASLPGEEVGPYVSQFLLQPIPYGMTTITQSYRIGDTGRDYLTDYDDWLAIQNGSLAKAPTFTKAQYISNARGLAEYVHSDFTYQAFLNAALILLSYGREAMADSNPYKQTLGNQQGFISHGAADILSMIAEASHCALKAAWYQKWALHRKLRPEMLGGRVHNHMTSSAHYPIDATLLDSPALEQVFSQYGSYLLPSAYPEGSPLHPSYPAGHGAIAGACVTVLKACFNESFVIPKPLVSTDDGQQLIPYEGTLTVGGELNKLASNIPRGRDLAGVHYLSDGYQGLLLGQAVATAMLKDVKRTYSEDFLGFTFSPF